MNIKMRYLLFCAGLSFIALQRAESFQEPESSYALHEWGVFTAPRDADWLMQDMLVEWQSFPEFFNGVLPKRELNYRGPVTKPVIFLHGEGKQQIDLLIQFADGHPMIWWPPAEHPADGMWYHGENVGPPDTLLRFFATLNSGGGEVKPVASDHWLNDLRAVDATPLTVHGTYSMRSLGSVITESFIYYDGLMKRPPAPRVARTDDGLSLSTESDHPWLDVTVIESSLDRKQIQFAKVDRIESGTQQTEIRWQPADLDGLKELANDLLSDLVEQGLNQDEAQSLLDVWSDGLLHRAGITVFYRITQETYDTWIPLHCKPKPKETVRVGLVVHHHLEPELEENVLTLINQLGSDRFEERNRAHRQLIEIGGAGVSTIKAAATSGNTEQAARARMILEDLDTEQSLQEAIERLKKVTNRK